MKIPEDTKVLDMVQALGTVGTALGGGGHGHWEPLESHVAPSQARKSWVSEVKAERWGSPV